MSEFNTKKVLFVGGPWDGQRREMDHTPSRFYVEVLTKVSDDVDPDTGKARAGGPVEASKVLYAKIELGGVPFYKSLPSDDWRKYPTHELATELFKGYRNL